ncbi:hypothetical protein MMC09_006377 [Bachmanniomyces sp. S44760]|nr:hypothetical protein [Bachmanniomyces sp. S44760]
MRKDNQSGGVKKAFTKLFGKKPSDEGSPSSDIAPLLSRRESGGCSKPTPSPLSVKFKKSYFKIPKHQGLMDSTGKFSSTTLANSTSTESNLHDMEKCLATHDNILYRSYSKDSEVTLSGTIDLCLGDDEPDSQSAASSSSPSSVTDNKQPSNQSNPFEDPATETIDTYAEDGSSSLDSAYTSPKSEKQSKDLDVLFNDISKIRLLDDQQMKTRGLLCSFTISDLKARNNYIVQVSSDLLSYNWLGKPPQENYSLPLYLEQAMRMHEPPTEMSKMDDCDTVSMSGFLVPRNDRRPTHRFFAAVDVQGLASTGDIWLDLANEEAGPEKVQKISNANTKRITELYLNYFTISPPSDSYRCTVTATGLNLVDQGLECGCSPEDILERYSKQLHDTAAKGRRFGIKLDREAVENQWLVCVPMFGPGLISWLCFVVRPPKQK